MAREEVTVKTQEHTDWNSLIKKKFRHDSELSNLNINGLVKKYEKFIYLKAGHFERYAKGVGSLLEMEDIASFGREGLLEAIKGYDSKFGVKFLSYAGRYITGYMHRGIDNSTSLGPYGLKKSREIKKAVTKLKREGVENPTSEQIANECGLSLPDVKLSLGDMSVSVTSLDTLLNHDGDSGTLEDIIPDKKDISHFQRYSQYDQNNGRIAEAMKSAGLSDQERYILTALAYEGKDNVQIGKKIKVSSTRVNQIIQKIEVKLRHSQFFVEELGSRFKISRN